MIIFGIDPGVSGAISVLENNKVLDVIEMPTNLLNLVIHGTV